MFQAKVIFKLSVRHLSRTNFEKGKFERFDRFLNHCECSDVEAIKIWTHVNAFESQKTAYQHVEPWFLAQENMKKIKAPTDGQKQCNDIIPNLSAHPFWDETQFPMLNDVTSNFGDIQNELLALINCNESSKGFQPYKNAMDYGSTEHGNWNVFYFFLHDLLFEENMKKFPKTMHILNGIEATKRLFPHALISCLAPNTHIIPHSGPTNKKLRIYLPLLLEEDTNTLTVNDECVRLKEGELIIFDDSFIHFACNQSQNKAKFTLIFDIWHPDLSEEEINFLSLIQGVFERKLLNAARSQNGCEEPDLNNPYYAMLTAQHIQIPNEQIYSGWQ